MTLKLNNAQNWTKARSDLAGLQHKVLKAHRSGNVIESRRAQEKLTKSFSARCFAVRKVTRIKEKTLTKLAGFCIIMMS